jgi:hypothetical protein
MLASSARPERSNEVSDLCEISWLVRGWCRVSSWRPLDALDGGIFGAPRCRAAQSAVARAPTAQFTVLTLSFVDLGERHAFSAFNDGPAPECR